MPNDPDKPSESQKLERRQHPRTKIAQSERTGAARKRPSPGTWLKRVKTNSAVGDCKE